MQITYIDDPKLRNCKTQAYALWQVRNGFALVSCNTQGIFRITWHPTLVNITVPPEKILAQPKALELRQQAKAQTLNYIVYGTLFQCNVWRQVASIPTNHTTSYADIARSIDSPAGSRAVGNAVGKNPLYMVIPCHRVVASDGSLGGYAYGLEHKQTILDCENRGEDWFV